MRPLFLVQNYGIASQVTWSPTEHLHFRLRPYWHDRWRYLRAAKHLLNTLHRREWCLFGSRHLRNIKSMICWTTLGSHSCSPDVFSKRDATLASFGTWSATIPWGPVPGTVMAIAQYIVLRADLLASSYLKHTNRIIRPRMGARSYCCTGVPCLRQVYCPILESSRCPSLYGRWQHWSND